MFFLMNGKDRYVQHLKKWKRKYYIWFCTNEYINKISKILLEFSISVTYFLEKQSICTAPFWRHIYIKQAFLLPRFALLITNFSRKRLLKMSSRHKNAIVRLCFPFPWNSKDRYKTWHTRANTNLKNSHEHILTQTHPHTHTYVYVWTVEK